MKKLRSVTLCLSVAFLFASCQKETQPAPQPDATSVRVIASDWVAASSLSWSAPADAPGAFAYANWNVPELSQDILDNNALLIFAKTNTSGSEQLFPARVNGSNTANFDLYRSIAGQQAIELSHTTYNNGTYTAPMAANEVRFRYILFKNIPRANARVSTGSMAGYNLDDLKRMDYNRLTALLSIGK